jgi:hypothetical protein
MTTVFNIANVLSSLVLDVPLDSAPIGLPNSWQVKFGNKAGAPVQQFTLEDEGGDDNQQWTLQSQGYLTGFQIVNHANPHYVIGVHSAAVSYVELQASLLVPSEGTAQQDTHALDNQLWLPMLAPVFNASGYNFINKGSGLVLDVPMALRDGNNGMAKALAIQQYASNKGLNQQWSFKKAKGHTLPDVSIVGLGATGGSAPLAINGTGFTSYEGQSMLLHFYSTVPGAAGGPAETSVQNGSFSLQYVTPAASVTLTNEQAQSMWASCYVTEESGAWWR